MSCYGYLYRKDSAKYKAANQRYSQSPKGRFSNAMSIARIRGIEWTLTFEEYEKLINQTCYFCDGELNKSGTGLDRLNNKLGYNPSNVKPCCKICNSMKNVLSTRDFLNHLRKILFK